MEIGHEKAGSGQQRGARRNSRHHDQEQQDVQERDAPFGSGSHAQCHDARFLGVIVVWMVRSFTNLDGSIAVPGRWNHRASVPRNAGLPACRRSMTVMIRMRRRSASNGSVPAPHHGPSSNIAGSSGTMAASIGDKRSSPPPNVPVASYRQFSSPGGGRGATGGNGSPRYAYVSCTTSLTTGKSARSPSSERSSRVDGFQ